MSKLYGFTLIEILVALAILISLVTLGIPSLLNFVISTRVDNEIYSIQRLLLLTRNAAINGSTKVTLCPLDNKNNCVNQWQNQLSVFTDFNNNRVFEPNTGEKLLTVKAAIKPGDVLQYGTSRIGLTYASTGHLAAWGQNATFSYCPKNHHDKSRGIIVAISGRSYLSALNKRGSNEIRRTGAKISCR